LLRQGREGQQGEKDEQRLQHTSLQYSDGILCLRRADGKGYLLADEVRRKVIWAEWKKDRSGFQKFLKKCLGRSKSAPQGLKPHCQQSTFGTAEAVPLSKTGFYRSQ
jgi:hypothetical protein